MQQYIATLIGLGCSRGQTQSLRHLVVVIDRVPPCFLPHAASISLGPPPWRILYVLVPYHFGIEHNIILWGWGRHVTYILGYATKDERVYQMPVLCECHSNREQCVGCCMQPLWLILGLTIHLPADVLCYPTPSSLISDMGQRSHKTRAKAQAQARLHKTQNKFMQIATR